ncbi:MAG: hypothetical protein LBR80_16910 [Deltaproteobacteria bacterium]|jgi:hypothetical protein|nr:hypothetical protein [Deltaproteobacteria bacterium]
MDGEYGNNQNDRPTIRASSPYSNHKFKIIGHLYPYLAGHVKAANRQTTAFLINSLSG